MIKNKIVIPTSAMSGTLGLAMTMLATKILNRPVVELTVPRKTLLCTAVMETEAEAMIATCPILTVYRSSIERLIERGVKILVFPDHDMEPVIKAMGAHVLDESARGLFETDHNREWRP